MGDVYSEGVLNLGGGLGEHKQAWIFQFRIKKIISIVFFFKVFLLLLLLLFCFLLPANACMSRTELNHTGPQPGAHPALEATSGFLLRLSSHCRAHPPACLYDKDLPVHLSAFSRNAPSTSCKRRTQGSTRARCSQVGKEPHAWSQDIS